MNIEALEVIITAIAVVASVFGKKYLDLRLSQLSPQKLHQVLTLADVIVQGVEVYGSDRKGNVTSPEKMALAVSALRSRAEAEGVNLSEDEALTYVHAALGGLRENEEYRRAQQAPDDVAVYNALANVEEAARAAARQEVHGQLTLIQGGDSPE